MSLSFLVRLSLLSRRFFYGLPKAHCQKSISISILTSTAWRTLGFFGVFPTRARGGEGALASCRAPHGQDHISRLFFSPKIPVAAAASLPSDNVFFKIGHFQLPQLKFLGGKKQIL